MALCLLLVHTCRLTENHRFLTGTLAPYVVRFFLPIKNNQNNPMAGRRSIAYSPSDPLLSFLLEIPLSFYRLPEWNCHHRRNFGGHQNMISYQSLSDQYSCFDSIGQNASVFVSETPRSMYLSTTFCFLCFLCYCLGFLHLLSSFPSFRLF